MTEVTAVRLVAWVEGRVQGVGFRWWVRSRALELGLVGFAENLADGRVKVVAEGASGGCRELLALLADGTASREVTRTGDAASRTSIAGGSTGAGVAGWGTAGVAGGSTGAGGRSDRGAGAGVAGGGGGTGADGGSDRGAGADLAARRGAGGGLVWPSRYRRPGRVTRVAYRWTDAAGDMSGFTER
jgi:acylphosphatase